MKTTKQKSLDWFNGLGKTKRDELSRDYYGSELLWDDEIEAMWMKEVPQENYTKKDILDAFNLGMDFRMRRLNGDYEITVEEVLNNFFTNNLK